MENEQSLIDTVIEQIAQDIIEGDVTALEELLNELSKDILIHYLPEDYWSTFK
jgi:hypothetical protein